MPPPPPAFRTALALAASLLLAACATRPAEYREPAPLTRSARNVRNLAVFDQAWELVNARYFDPQFRGVDWAAMRELHRPDAARARDDDELYLVLNRLLAELHDRHVFAISPRHVHEGRQHHGMGFGFREQVLPAGRTVTEVTPGGPAEAAGIRIGWRILSPAAAQLASAAHAGQGAGFEFLDERDRPRTLRLSPALLPFAHLRTDSHLVAGGVLYLRFDHFNRSSVSWLSRELKRHLAAPAAIVDLRGNVGGDSTALQLAAREFFAEGRNLGRTVDRAGTFRQLDTLSFFSARYPGRVFVLVGEATASSAEIFAHALQFHRRATLIGRQTAGSVVAGFKHRLPDGGYVNVAQQDFVGLDNQRLEGRGVTPDCATPLPTLAEIRAGHDPDLLMALTAAGRH